jgi:DNA-binding transcriptional LysR family regulator
MMMNRIDRITMEIRHLQHFVALSEEGSFTRAAQRMHIVQSGLSASIKELELELGSRLVERTTRKVALTESGRLFLEHARTTLAALESGITAVRSQDGVVRGRLHLGILQSLGPYLELPVLLKGFRAAYPQVEIAVRALSTDSIPALVGSGDVDLSFHALVRRTEWPGLQVIPYAQDSLVAICPSHHPQRSTKSIRLEELVQRTFVDLTPDRALRRVVDQMFAEHHIKRNTVFEVSDVQTAMQFVEEGLGVAVVPSRLARSLAASHRILSFKISNQDPYPPRWRIAILRRSRQNGLPGKSTVDLFLEALAAVPRVPSN